MFDLALVVERIRARVSGLVDVGGAAALNRAMDSNVAVPAMYVLPLAERATPAGTLGQVRMKVALGFGVVLVLNNRRDNKGAAAMGDLLPFRKALRTALVGWVPEPENGEAVLFTDGRMLQMDAEGRLWWTDEFVVSYYFQEGV